MPCLANHHAACSLPAMPLAVSVTFDSLRPIRVKTSRSTSTPLSLVDSRPPPIGLPSSPGKWKTRT
eukprot:scaffold149759_cov37-Attheya_sp.AAC.2